MGTTMTTTPRAYEPLSVEQLQALHANLNPERVAKRTGGGNRQLSYLEAYDIKATLIRVFGYGGFSADVLDAQIVQIVPGNDKYVTVLAKATVRITIHQTGATYTETAAASQAGSQGIGEVADFAIKTAESDALKRAAIYLGTQFGLSLYDDGSTRDVVRRVVSPDQADITRDLVAARQGGTGNAEVDAAANAARQRLQERLKVHKPAPDAEPERTENPEEPAQEAQEPAQAPTKPKAAPRARKAPTAREKAARAALANAEATVGLKTKDRPNFPPPSVYDEQDGEVRDPAADGSER